MMENNLKQAVVADMYQHVISEIVENYIDQIFETNNVKLELSIKRLYSEDTKENIMVEISKDGDSSVNGVLLKTVKLGRSDLWNFIVTNLPNYYHRDDILQFDIYSRYLENEDVCESDLQLIYNDFGSEKWKVKETIYKMEKAFAYEALMSWLLHYG